MAEVVGLSALHARFHALENANMTKGMMLKAASYTRGQMVKNMIAVGARKTGTTAGSIQPRNVTETSAEIWGSKVLVYIDEGTGVEGPLHHRITPKAARVLAWQGGGSRLTGRGKGATWHFAKSTKGMAPRPYIKRSVQEAGQAIDTELSSVVIDTWNAGA
jgi:hypothetical protein